MGIVWKIGTAKTQRRDRSPRCSGPERITIGRAANVDRGENDHQRRVECQ